MSPEQRIKHEFLLMQGKLGEDEQFFHFDKCPEILDGAYQLTFDALHWLCISDKEMKEVAFQTQLGNDSFKALVLRKMRLLCHEAKEKIDSLIMLLETEKSDAKTKNIGTTESG
jgi:hypothetical protein